MELTAMVLGISIGIISIAALLSNSEHTKAMLLQYAKQTSYQFAVGGSSSNDAFLFVQEFVNRNALIPAVLSGISILFLLIFAVSAVTRAIKNRKLPISSKTGVLLPGGFRILVVSAIWVLCLVVTPGVVVSSATHEASSIFSAAAIAQAQVASVAEQDLSDAKTASLIAHAKSGELYVTKTQAQMDCRGSRSAVTYYSGDGYTSPGNYNSCLLEAYLQKMEYDEQQTVAGTDYVLSSAETAATNAAAKLKLYKGNSNSVAMATAVVQRVLVFFMSFAILAFILPLLLVRVRQSRARSDELPSNVRQKFNKGFVRRSKCPKCAEYVKAEALICKHCGSEISAKALEAE